MRMQKSPVIPERFPAPIMDRLMYLYLTLYCGEEYRVITFTGQIDAERMVRAVRLTLDAEPILGCRFIEHPRRPYWERREDLDNIPLCNVVETQNLEKELLKFMGASLDPCVGPQVQASIFRSKLETLCIKINHTVADGASVDNYVGLLAKTYRELSVDPTYSPEPNLRGSRGQGQVFRQVGLRSLIKALYRFRYQRANKRLGCSFPMTSQDLSGRAFTIRRIKPERFATIKAYCLQHKVTVSDVLLTAYYHTLFKVFNIPANAPLSVRVTTDLRRHLPSSAAKTICNLGGSFFITVSRTLVPTFEDTLAQVHAALVAAKSNQPWLVSGLLLALSSVVGYSLWRRMIQRDLARKVKKAKSFPIFVNIGIIDIQQVDFGDNTVIDVSSFGAVPYPTIGALCALSVNTFGNTMVFTMSFCDTATDRKTVERFLDLFVCELPE